MKRFLVGLSLAALAASLGSCSIIVPATKAVTDGVEYVVGDAQFAHTTEPYATDMFDDDTFDRVWEEYRARYYSFKRDYDHIRSTAQKLFFNYDKDDPYVHQ